jgi:hypothetical protein
LVAWVQGSFTLDTYVLDILSPLSARSPTRGPLSSLSDSTVRFGSVGKSYHQDLRTRLEVVEWLELACTRIESPVEVAVWTGS